MTAIATVSARTPTSAKNPLDGPILGEVHRNTSCRLRAGRSARGDAAVAVDDVLGELFASARPPYPRRLSTGGPHRHTWRRRLARLGEARRSLWCCHGTPVQRKGLPDTDLGGLVSEGSEVSSGERVCDVSSAELFRLVPHGVCDFDPAVVEALRQRLPEAFNPSSGGGMLCPIRGHAHRACLGETRTTEMAPCQSHRAAVLSRRPNLCLQRPTRRLHNGPVTGRGGALQRPLKGRDAPARQREQRGRSYVERLSQPPGVRPPRTSRCQCSRPPC